MKRKQGGDSEHLDYQSFLEQKSQLGTFDGFEPIELPGYLKDFQAHLVDWALRKGKAALFEFCGSGKTVQQLVWADNVVRHTNKPVLILAPLAVSFQTAREAEKFSIDCKQSRDGKPHKHITVTNYEKLHLFNPDDYAGVVCDESGILKDFEAVYRAAITEFMRKLPYRLLCSATPAPNDYTELGNSSEALGGLGHVDMLNMFFRNNRNTSDRKGHWRGSGRMTKNNAHLHIWVGQNWRFKGHAEMPFWRWVCSWARAMRKPSDFGFDDAGFVLPPLKENIHIIDSETLADGMLFPLPAVGLDEQREERRRTIKERCEKVAELVSDTGNPALVWGDLNPECDLLENLIDDGLQVSGKHSDEIKEERFKAFTEGELRVLITKKKIGAWGLNFQHCAHIASFPTHSYESHFQGIHRCLRYGQKNTVKLDMVMTEGEKEVMKNLQRKTEAADIMFSRLVECMNESMAVDQAKYGAKSTVMPEWLKGA